MELYINGDVAQVGIVCEQFYLEQIQNSQTIHDQANVAYFCFDSQWFQLYFDGVTIFWRVCSEPTEPINSDFSSYSSLVNFSEIKGICRHALTRIEQFLDSDIIILSLIFDSGVVLKFEYFSLGDYTKVTY
ncbi:hypothetical protein ACEWAX_05765 [Vibrio parahaemolyticus]|uniref:hypothetical protein n=1 Tax=Vibrio parahaemolyticus TaxID=670 RepID=UPI000463EEBC|nr:hypothetical protein [Vibrio parahaemolyticus]MBE3731262.1 hypothetical protein [Vibrio parahaemolyticus]MBE3858410.1 hypothetical protein [Vibrio parahaemolyticus]MBE4804611.1 hypothetical protein [Vibrio parahaemolyticus]MCX8951402.1 hypothetical protein [Vibrio parahaemolyticus]TOB75773.1 hypothetical protein CGJ99_23015 [Vibrio parahaemolyticus]